MAVVALDSRLNDLVDPNVQVEQIATGCQFTEGPLWDPRDDSLIFSDVRTGIMRRWTKGGVQVFRDAEHTGIANGNTWDHDGNLLTCEHAGRRVSRTLRDGSVEALVSRWGDKRLNSPNDVISAANGDVLFTDPTYGLRQRDGSIVGQEYPYPGVFRLSREKGTLQLLVGDFAAPNGLALTEDASKLYICDTREQHIRVFDVLPDGTIENGRVFCEAKLGEEHQGRPDGMKLDSQGNVYLAANSPEGIWVWNPDGVLLGFIGVGESPANLAWGGEDWQTMYVTAQTSVYRLRTKIPGQPVRFAPRS
jgi:gluconolactonase